MKIPRQYSQVVFDTDSVDDDTYVKHYQQKFPTNKIFFFLGEVPNAPGHCLLVDNGKIIGMYHTENFKEITDDEE